MVTVLAKGPNFVFAREFIQQKYGEQTWEAVLTMLPEEAVAIWRSATLEEAHPFTTFKQGVNALSEVLGSPEMLEMAEMYQHIADRSLNTLYKAFFRLTSPIFVIKNYPRLWERFFTAGKVEIPSSDKNQAIVTFTVPDIFLDWLPPACLGYSQKAVEMAGGKYFAMRQLNKKQLLDGDWEVAFKLSWQ